jgi:hypothetical protein
VAIVALPVLGWLLWARRDLLRAWPVVLASAVVGGLPWLLGNARHDWYSFHPGRNEGTWAHHAYNLVVSTLPEALGLRLAWSYEWLGGGVLGAILYVAILAGFAWLLVRRSPPLRPLLLIAALFPIFYFVSPYTWLGSEPRYLTLVMPVFALLIAYAATTWVRAAAVLAVAAALSFGGMAELERHHVAPVTSEGRPVPTSIQPVLAALRSHDVHYAFASYWVAWRITFESDVHIVGAKASYSHPFASGHRVWPGDPKNDRGIDSSYYALAERHRDVAHVFILGGDVEPHVRALLARTGYRRVVTGSFAVWLPTRP